MSTFHCLVETNEWEGETWYHYFLDGPGVLEVLHEIYEREDTDFDSLDTDDYSDQEAERLTNRDETGYMQCHWFGELTNPEGLKAATEQELYKGGVRNFGEELFEVVEEEDI